MLRYPARTHPYSGVRHDAAGRYYDFKSKPEMIGEVLEDFKPYEELSSVQHFYRLLRYVNRPDGPLETTDCGLARRFFRSSNSPFPTKAGWLGGRLMLMFRDLNQNCSKKRVFKLVNTIQRKLAHYGRQSDYVGFVVGPFPTVFTATGRRGFQVDIEFAMWGDTVEEAIARFEVVVRLMEKAILDCETSASIRGRASQRA